MITQEISLKIWGHVEDYILINNFDILLDFYKKSGQVLIDNVPFYIESNFIKCIVLTPEKNSFAKKYNTNWVNLQLQKIQNLYLAIPQIKLLGECVKNDNSVCTCKKSDFYILNTNHFVILGPVECGSCNNFVPLYKLVGLSQECKESILSWEEIYQCYSKIEFRCIGEDKLAIEQMAEYNSALSTEGIKISKEIYKITGVPTYYYLLNNKKIEFKKESQLLCPSCNCEWFLKIPLHITYSYKCDKCYLISCFASYINAEYKEILTSTQTT